MNRSDWAPSFCARAVRGASAAVFGLSPRRHWDVVRRTQPAARMLEDAHAGEPVCKRRRNPDVVEPAALVRRLPIGRAVAPPSIELRWLRRVHAHGVDPAARVLNGDELLAFERCVRDDAQHLLMTPDIVLERRDIEIADQNHAVAVATQRRACPHLIQEGELMREFRIDSGIGRIAASGYVEIMQRDWIAQARALTEHRRDVPAVRLAAK